MIGVGFLIIWMLKYVFLFLIIFKLCSFFLNIGNVIFLLIRILVDVDIIFWLFFI